MSANNCRQGEAENLLIDFLLMTFKFAFKAGTSILIRLWPSNAFLYPHVNQPAVLLTYINRYLCFTVTLLPKHSSEEHG